MKNKIVLFSHTDLDGMGVAVVSKKYAEGLDKELVANYCSYGDINEKVENFLNDVELLSDTCMVLIGDISVNDKVARILEEKRIEYGFSLILRDHHETAKSLNVYDWAQVYETDDEGIGRCGTYWMSKALHNYYENKIFVDTVNSWDTWEWKVSDNIHAKWLDILHKGMGGEEFINYILSIDMSMVRSASALFDLKARTIVEVLEKKTESIAKHCNENIKICTLGYKEEYFKVGIVFCNSDISMVADYILSNRPELDFLMLFSLPGAVSLRSQKNLRIPLGEIAKVLTGSGGGHPKASGAGIDSRFFNEVLLPKLVYDLNPNTTKDNGIVIWNVK